MRYKHAPKVNVAGVFYNLLKKTVDFSLVTQILYVITCYF